MAHLAGVPPLQRYTSLLFRLHSPAVDQVSIINTMRLMILTRSTDLSIPSPTPGGSTQTNTAVLKTAVSVHSLRTLTIHPLVQGHGGLMQLPLTQRSDKTMSTMIYTNTMTNQSLQSWPGTNMGTGSRPFSRNNVISWSNLPTTMRTSKPRPEIGLIMWAITTAPTTDDKVSTTTEAGMKDIA